MGALPQNFVQRLQAIVPAAAFQSVVASFQADRPVSLRLNPLRGSPEDTMAELRNAGLHLTRHDFLPWAASVPFAQRDSVTHHALAAQGKIYVQSFSSMLAPFLLAPQPGETVLDLAAAPGGKTLLLAALMENQGKISAVEPVKDRFFRLKANVDLHGATCVKLYRKDGRAVGRLCPRLFDRVLLDAPCSSESRMDPRDEKSMTHWSEKKIREAARKQHGLIFSAWQALKPGGRLLYCTCSFAPEENEAVVSALLDQVGESACVVPLSLPQLTTQPGLSGFETRAYRPELQAAVRVLPDTTWDGFFLCLLEKVA